MTEDAIKRVLENLWYRVRHLEMIVVKQSDNMETNRMLHGLRNSLYETSELYCDHPIKGTFEEIYGKEQASQ